MSEPELDRGHARATGPQRPLSDRSEPLRRTRGLALASLGRLPGLRRLVARQVGLSATPSSCPRSSGSWACWSPTSCCPGIFWKSFTHLPPAAGRVLAIIPVYNEEPHLVARGGALDAAADDPSRRHPRRGRRIRVPLETFDDPLVTWHRIDNSGKRHAQAHVLKMFAAGRVRLHLHRRLGLRARRRRARAHAPVDEGRAGPGRHGDDPGPELGRELPLPAHRHQRRHLLPALPDGAVVAGHREPDVGGPGDLPVGRGLRQPRRLPRFGDRGNDRRLSFYALLRGQVVGVSEAIARTQCRPPGQERSSSG